jgi:5-methylcytosine-specific restriction protein A
MTELSDLKPTSKPLVMDLLKDVGVDVSQLAKMKGGAAKAASNPKYCYNWSFEQPGEVVAVCLWYPGLKKEGGKIVHRLHPKSRGSIRPEPGGGSWNRRAADLDKHISLAFSQQLPIRVIVVEGEQRNPSDPKPKASVVEARLLDNVAWAVTEYNFSTGEWLLVRGAKPEAPAIIAPDVELSWFEGWRKRAFIFHRRREAKARREKIKQAKALNGGKLICEVPNCDFDFGERYGKLGEGYVQVHHLEPLSKSPKEGRPIKLKDLAVVCANCHVMIHLGGECRPLKGLIA